MALDKELADIFKLLKDFLSGIAATKSINNKSKSEPLVSSEDNQKFQSPIRTSWVNIGDFAPGRYLNKTHAKGHDGIDMQAPKGTPLYPITNGVVSFVGTDVKGGNVINISYNGGKIKSYYAHLDKISVEKGQKVSVNDIVGSVGNSGNARNTSSHVHVQVWSNGSLVNPSQFFYVPSYGKKSTNKKRSSQAIT